jgi:hypothetical protein
MAMTEDMSRAKVLTAADIAKIAEGFHWCGEASGPLKRLNPECGCMCGSVYSREGKPIISHGRNGMRCKCADDRGCLISASRLKADAVEPKTALETLAELLTEAKAVPVINGVRIEPKEALVYRLDVCPFCGEVPEEVHTNDLRDFYVGCANEQCPVQPETGLQRSAESARKEWNWKLKPATEGEFEQPTDTPSVGQDLPKLDITPDDWLHKECVADNFKLEAEIACLRDMQRMILESSSYWQKLYVEAMIQLQSLRDKESAVWIDCSQRMPEDDHKKFWCYIVPRESYWFDVPGHEHQTEQGTWEPRQDACTTFRTSEGDVIFNCGCEEKVTHWMPLPVAPTKLEQEKP